MNALLPVLALVAAWGAPPRDTGAARLPDPRIEAGRVELRFEEAHRPAAQALADVADGHAADLCEQLGGCPSGPALVVVVARDVDGLRRHLGPGVPDWATGIAFPPAGVAGVTVAQPGGASWAEVIRTFRHELSHLLLHRVTGGRPVPRWFKEGFATVQGQEWSFERVRTLTGAALTGRLLRMGELDRGFPSGRGKASLAYAQAVSLVAWLMADDGEAFARTLAGLRDGVAFERALAGAYGRPVSQIEADWQDDLVQDYRWVPLLTGGSTVWVVATVIFLLGYRRRRRDAKATLAAWAAEEARPPAPW